MAAWQTPHALSGCLLCHNTGCDAGLGRSLAVGNASIAVWETWATGAGCFSAGALGGGSNLTSVLKDIDVILATSVFKNGQKQIGQKKLPTPASYWCRKTFPRHLWQMESMHRCMASGRFANPQTEHAS